MKNIAVIGPESTGKSTLSQQLAEHFHTAWCPEYARSYLTTYGREYNYADLLTIAKEQLKSEDALRQQAKNGLYFIDTEMYVMKTWCEIVFNNCHTWILRQIASRKYDLYLLCNTDLLWQIDELREYPSLEFRQMLYNIYKDAVVNSGTPWAEISGKDPERLQMAIDAVNKLQTPLV